MAQARDVMTTSVVTIDQDTPANEVAHLLLEEGISGAPVVDAHGTLVGVVSLRDLVRQEAGEDPFHREGFWIDFNWIREPVKELDDHRPVSEVMSKKPFHVAQDAPVSQLVELMLLYQFHRLVVTDERKKIVGIVSTMDLVAYLGKLLGPSKSP